jgi:hypothetical protein
VSWPFGEQECPRCSYFDPLEPPAYDDVGYEIPGYCLHPRIAMELFRMRTRDAAELAGCPCFTPRRESVLPKSGGRGTDVAGAG